jgi:hypothetical protein
MDVIGVTASVSVTETAAGVSARRGVIGTTEVTSIVANAANINRTRKSTGATKAIILAELTGSIAIRGTGTVSTVFSGLGASTIAVSSSHFSLHDTALVREEFANVWDFEIHEIVIAGDSTEFVFEQSLTSVINVSNEILESNIVIYVSEPVLVGDVLGPVIWDAHLSPSAFSSSEVCTFGLAEALTSVVAATETLEASRDMVLSDTILAADTPTASTRAAETVVGVVLVADELTPIVLENLTAAVNVAATFTDTASPQQSLTTILSIGDSLIPVVFQNSTLVNVVNLIDTLIIAAATYNEALSDNVVVASEELWASDFAAAAWVLNLATGGLSTYDNFGYGSVAAHDGVLYATNPEGVFALSGDKDQTRNVTGRVKTGMLDFDIKSKKRISDIFVGYTGGSLSYEVETYDGPQEVYTYEMPERSADAPRNNRVKPGRGLSSRYWRFTVTNVDGADFQLHDQTAVVAASQRRL